MSPHLKASEPSRRQFLASTGLTTLAVGAGSLTSHALAANAEPAAAKAPSISRDKRYNILFILTDQERYLDSATLPNGYSLPGRERMRREGVSFVNHQIATSVCSSSRSVIYTGQHIQQTGVFDNLGFPWSKQLSHDTPTFGQYLAKAGYHPAYLGKCHMVDALEEVEVENAPTVSMDELSKVMQSYGFEDYVGVGDIIGSTMGGYKSDEFTASTAVRWLRTQVPHLRNEGKPWFLALNLVNPHDVMYFNTDVPGADPVQDDNLLFDVNFAPDHALYQRQWDMPLPESRKEPWEYQGRPRAHYEFQYARMALVGQFPNEDARWKRLQDYYLNCIADCDSHVDRVLRELDELGLADNTIVILTSDHGELCGAHGMHGKGATAYKEQLHVPLWIRHPGNPESAGKKCSALTSHLDLAPTILGLADVNTEQRKTIAPDIKGHDFTNLLASPTTAAVDAVRNSALYNFNMWLYLDAEFMQMAIAAKLKGQDLSKLGLKIDLDKRGAIRSVTDGRYRFTRYFSPKKHHLPSTLEEIFKFNDVELYDMQKDPHEIKNLAVDRRTHGDLLVAMNQKLTNIIQAEVGEDDGSFLPENRAGWAITVIDL